MADVVLTVTFKSLKVTKAVERFLKSKPNDEKKPKAGEVPDARGHYTPDQLEPIYPTTKLWVEECCRRYIYEQIRLGHNMLQREAHAVLEPKDDYLG